MHEHLESKGNAGGTHLRNRPHPLYLISATRHNQSSFAKAIGVDAASVSRILGSDRRPSEAFLNRIVVNLGVSKQWLTEGTDVPFPAQPALRRLCTAGRPGIRHRRHRRKHSAEPYVHSRERIMGRVCLPGIDPRPTHCARERRLHDAQAAPPLLRVYPTG